MDPWFQPLISLSPQGLFCKKGEFHIDPSRAVETAVVTHAHSDHARRGSKKYICVASGVGLLKSRLGQNIQVEGKAYREVFQLGDVNVSFHSAGHILGSAQVRVEHQGQVWVASGDYKRDADPSCDPFEVVKCDTFISEATFGTPKYVWEKNVQHGKMISDWWQSSAAEGKNCVLFGYSLGKAQRILAELQPYAQKPVLIHATIRELTECYRKEGRKLAPTEDLISRIGSVDALKGELILAPPSILDETWIRKLGNYETAFASGWMQNLSGVYGRHYDRGFVMSDHADWNDLNRTIEESGATRVFVQHRNGALVRHLRHKGLDAHPEEMLAVDRYPEIGGITPRLL